MNSSRTWRTGIGVVGVMVFVFMYLPILVVIAYAFLPSELGVIRYGGITLTWYRQLFGDADLLGSLRNSLVVAIPAVAVAVSVGTYAAFIFHRYRVRGARLMMALLLLPYVMPGIITGVAFSLVFRELNMPGSLFTVAVGQVAIDTPLAMYLVLNRLRQLDPTLEQAGRDLGGTSAQVLRDIVLPSIGTAVLGAALLSFTIAFDEIAVSFFLVGAQLTLPVKVWTLLRFGYTPEVNALYSIVFVVSVSLIAGTMWAMNRGRSERKAATEG